MPPHHPDAGDAVGEEEREIASLSRYDTSPREQPAPVAPEPPEPPPSLADGGYQAALERYDRQLIAAALDECSGSIRETARLLGISRNTLRNKMKRYGL